MSISVSNSKSADDLAIHAVVQSLIDAWHHGDGDAFAQAFVEDADFYNVFAQRLCGRSSIARHHAQLFATVYHGTRVSDVDLSIRFVQPGVAAVAWSSVLHVGGEKRPAHALTVFVRIAEHWKILVLQNMSPLPNPS